MQRVVTQERLIINPTMAFDDHAVILDDLITERSLQCEKVIRADHPYEMKQLSPEGLVIRYVTLTHKLNFWQRSGRVTDYLVIRKDTKAESRDDILPGFTGIRVAGVIKKHERSGAKETKPIEYKPVSNSVLLEGKIDLATLDEDQSEACYELLHAIHTTTNVSSFPQGINRYRFALNGVTYFANIDFKSPLVAYVKKDKTVGFQAMGPQFAGGGAKQVHLGLFSLVRRASGTTDLTRSRSVVKIVHDEVDLRIIHNETALSKRTPYLHTKDPIKVNFGGFVDTLCVIERELQVCDLSAIIANERKIQDSRNLKESMESRLQGIKNYKDSSSDSDSDSSSDSSDSESIPDSAVPTPRDTIPASRSGLTTPRSSLTTPRSGYATPRSVPSTPRADVPPLVMSTRDRLTLAIEILYALKEQMHDCGITHRDMKPDNLRVYPGTHRVRVMDLGLSKNTGVTDNLETFCSMSYIPLEAIRNEPRTERSDVYSTGVTIAELFGMRRDLRTEDDARNYAKSPTFPGLFSIDDLSDHPLGNKERQHFQKILEKMMLPKQSERCTVEEAIEQMEQVRLAYQLSQAPETKHAAIEKAHKLAIALRKVCYAQTLAHKERKAQTANKSITAEDVDNLVKTITAQLDEVDDSPEALQIFIDTLGVEAIRGMKTKSSISDELSYIASQFKNITNRLAELSAHAKEFLDGTRKSSTQMHETATKIQDMVAYLQKKCEKPCLTFDEITDTPGDPGLATRLINKYTKHLAPLEAQFSLECDEFERAQKLTSGRNPRH